MRKLALPGQRNMSAREKGRRNGGPPESAARRSARSEEWGPPNRRTQHRECRTSEWGPPNGRTQHREGRTNRKPHQRKAAPTRRPPSDQPEGRTERTRDGEARDATG
jgi:hypothetical protein